MALTDRLTETLGIVATMSRARLLAPMRPDKYLRIAAAMRRENMGITSGFAAAAQRCPDRPSLVDELGTPDLARNRRARRRIGRRSSSTPSRPESHRHHGTQPPRLRRGA